MPTTFYSTTKPTTRPSNVEYYEYITESARKSARASSPPRMSSSYTNGGFYSPSKTMENTMRNSFT